MTEQEIVEIAERHHPEPDACYWRGPAHDGQPPLYRHSHRDLCTKCSTDDHDEPWPCDAARLLEHIRTVSEP